MAYIEDMVFIETPAFTRLIKTLMADEDYGRAQRMLAAAPEIGDVIEGTGGLRKVLLHYVCFPDRSPSGVSEERPG